MDGPRIIEVNGVDLCVDTAGDPADPAILLIAGMGSSMDWWWEEEFCQQLAAGGRFVIRYDHRDTGRSASYPAGAPGYTGADLAADAAGVLDAVGRRSAHLAGISMGGALAQQVALAHPGRVDSLMLISTSPAVPRFHCPGPRSCYRMRRVRNRPGQRQRAQTIHAHMQPPGIRSPTAFFRGSATTHPRRAKVRQSR
jgi:pimeloyl-ACP methyl ester carboxylesterase